MTARGMVALLLAGAVGCSDGPGSGSPAQTDSRTGEDRVGHAGAFGGGQDDEDDHLSVLDTMADLGYVDFVEEAADPAETRLVLHEPDAHGGYTLYTSIPHGISELIDVRGEVVRSWTANPKAKVTRCELLPDGDVLAIGYEPAPFLARWGFNGKEIWKLHVPAHHDVDVLPDGRILVLGEERRVVPELHPGIKLSDNLVVMLSPEGDLLKQHSVYDMLAAPGAPFSFRGWSKPWEETTVIDLIHANSIAWMEAPELAGQHEIYEPGNVLVCLRYQDAVAVFDWEEARLVWSWGQTELQKPHEASLLPSGNILVLDNGHVDRGYTRIVEVDPRTGEIVWEYKAAPPESFFTPARGTVQLLSNGNVFIGYSSGGEAFEVTRAGRRLWRFVNPHLDKEGHRGSIRAQRYEPELVERIMREHAKGQ